MRPGTHEGRLLGGRYRVGRPLGHGGMSDVHVARDPVLGRDVAIKLVSADRLGPDGVRRLEREARRAGALSHPNVVTVHDAVTDGDVAGIVMELCRGGTLADRLRAGPVPWTEAVEIASAVAAGLGAAHARGLVHRDVKPSNVFLDPDGAVKIGDFGIATGTEATVTTTVRGSVPYVAPEQATGRDTDPRTDVYALGCVLYEMLTGQPPFASGDTAAIIAQHLQAVPAPPSHLNPDVPPALDDSVLRMLAKEPDDRPADMGAVSAHLVHASSAEATRILPPAGAPASSPDKQRPLGRLLLLGAGGLAVALVVSLIVSRGLGGPTLPEVLELASPSPPATDEPNGDVDSAPVDDTTGGGGDPAPDTVDAAASELRRLLVDGRRAGDVSAKAEQDLDKIVTEILQKHADGDLEDVRSKADDFEKKLRDFVDKREVARDHARALEDMLDRLVDLAR